MVVVSRRDGTRPAEYLGPDKLLESAYNLILGQANGDSRIATGKEKARKGLQDTDGC